MYRHVTTPIQLRHFRALCCGVCGFAFEDEARLRRHTAEVDEDGDAHDGEPWSAVTLHVGRWSIWEEGTPAEERVQITHIIQNADGEVWVKSGGYWNELARFVEATAGN